MKIKLFFIINTLEGGGAERVISNLANKFYTKNYDVTIICLNEAPVSYVLAPGVRNICLLKRRNSSNAFYRLYCAGLIFYRLLSVLAKEKPRYVISFMTTANLWTGIACSILNIPYVVSERITPDYTINKYNYLLKWISAAIYKHSQFIVIPAKGMMNGFRRNKFFSKLENFKTIHNPVNAFAESSSDSVYPKKYILAVGRLDRQKGFDVLINAFSKVRNLDIDLLISGQGDQKESLLRQILALGLMDRVKLIGFKDNLQDYYRQAEMFVLSSRNEGYPNALVEAMSLGCACISTNCEFGPSEIIRNGYNGLLVSPENADELAQAILDVQTNIILKRRIAKNAQKINQTNSIDSISLKWEHLILSHV